MEFWVIGSVLSIHNCFMISRVGYLYAARNTSENFVVLKFATLAIHGTQFPWIRDKPSMSVDIDSPQLPRPKKHTKSKDKDVQNSEKKRKRKDSEEITLPSHTKKHKSKHHSKPPIAHNEPPLPLASPIDSPFHQQTSSLYLPLPPIAQRHALQGICAEHLSPLILTYYPPFHGVIVSYSNARLSSHSAIQASVPAYSRAIDEYAASFIWLTADFLIFKPQKGTVIEGYVNLQNESNLGLVCWNFFNASIEKRRLPAGWKWVAGGLKPSRTRKLKRAAKSMESDSEETSESDADAEREPVEDTQGYFQDADGKRIEGLIRFKVKSLETSRSMDRDTGFLSIEGTMLSEQEEGDMQEQEAVRTPDKRKRQLNRNAELRYAMSGALANGYNGAMEVDSTPSLQHRARY